MKKDKEFRLIKDFIKRHVKSVDFLLTIDEVVRLKDIEYSFIHFKDFLNRDYKERESYLINRYLLNRNIYMLLSEIENTRLELLLLIDDTLNKDLINRLFDIDVLILKGITDYNNVINNTDVEIGNLFGYNDDVVNTLKFRLSRNKTDNKTDNSFFIKKLNGDLGSFLNLLKGNIDFTTNKFPSCKDLLKDKIYLDISNHLDFCLHHEIDEFTFEEQDKVYRCILKSITEDEVLGELREITKLKESNEINNHNAYYDSLTKLARREYFEMEFEKALFEKVSNPNNLLGCVMFIDVDDFKKINDTYGHDIGDFVLKFIAQSLQKSVRSGDLVCRFAGDEFTILCKNLRAISDLELIVERIVSEITNRPLKIEEGKELVITLSIGIALYPEHGLTVEDLVKCADMAMYKAKNSGKNAYRIFETTMKEEETARRLIRNDLKNALDNGELYLEYMLQYNSEKNEYVGLESLMRWNHPIKGLISPAEFIQIAEQSGMIVDMGYWALEESLKHIKLIEEKGYGNLKLCINLTDLQMKQSDLVEKIVTLLKKYDIDGSRLLLEISEKTSTWTLKSVLGFLTNLRDNNINICIDDYGTGNSSLSSMHRIPLTHIKVNRTFVNGIEKDSSNYKIIKSLMDLSENLDVEVIAEGVELLSEYELLNELGCHNFQGFLISRPQKFENLIEILKEHNSNSNIRLFDNN